MKHLNIPKYPNIYNYGDDGNITIRRTEAFTIDGKHTFVTDKLTPEHRKAWAEVDRVPSLKEILEADGLYLLVKPVKSIDRLETVARDLLIKSIDLEHGTIIYFKDSLLNELEVDSILNLLNSERINNETFIRELKGLIEGKYYFEQYLEYSAFKDSLSLYGANTVEVADGERFKIINKNGFLLFLEKSDIRWDTDDWRDVSDAPSAYIYGLPNTLIISDKISDRLTKELSMKMLYVVIDAPLKATVQLLRKIKGFLFDLQLTELNYGALVDLWDQREIDANYENNFLSCNLVTLSDNEEGAKISNLFDGELVDIEMMTDGIACEIINDTDTSIDCSYYELQLATIDNKPSDEWLKMLMSDDVKLSCMAERVLNEYVSDINNYTLMF